MKSWRSLLLEPRWAGVSDEYGPHSQEIVSAVEALSGAPWFSNVGDLLDVHDGEAVPDWESALLPLTGSAAYGPNGHLLAPSTVVIEAHEGFEDHAWWQRIRAEVRRYYHYRFYIPRSLSEAQATFLFEHLYEFESFLFMEIIYADFHRCTYFREMLAWLVAGRFPCGWHGAWPEGRRRVF